MLKKIIKISSVILVSIITILIILLVFTGMGFFNPFIAKTTSFYSSKNLNAEIKLESISGNVFSKFHIYGVSLSYDYDTIASCSEVEIEFSLKNIFQKSISIEKLIISDLYINAVQDWDSTWNFANVIRANEEPDSVSGNLNWNINIKDFQLNGFIAEIDQYKKSQFIPEYIESSVRLNGAFRNDTLIVNFDTVNVLSINPAFEISQIQGNFIYSKKDFSWENFMLLINNSTLTSRGKLDLITKSIINSSLQINPLDFEDIKSFFPDLNLYGEPEITLFVNGNTKQYNIDLNLTEEHQQLKLIGWLKDLEENPSYELLLEIDSIDGEFWTQNEQFNSVVVGKLNVKGEGFDIKENSFSIKGQFGDIKYGDYSLKDLIVETTKRNDQLIGSLKSKTWIGNVNLKYNLNNIFTNPTYELYCDYQNLNLKNFPGIDSVYTNLNGNIFLAGQGKSIEELNTKLVINSYDSKVLDYPINDFKINAYYNKGDYSFTGLHMNTPYFLLDAEGNGNLYKSNNIKFEFYPRNIYDLISEFEIPIYKVNGTIKGTVNGAIHSLKADASVSLNNILYDSIHVEKLNSNFNVNINDSLYRGLVNLSAENINFNGFELKKITTSDKFSNNLIQTQIQLNVNDSLQADFEGDIESFENPFIQIKKLNINYNKSKWVNDFDSTYILLTPDYAYINRFSLKAGNQKIKIHGYFTFEGDEDMDVQIQNFKLAQIPFQKFLPYSISGNLTTSLNISGTSENPIIKNDLYMDSLVVNNYPFKSLKAQIDYQDENLIYSGTINSVLHRNITTSANLPVHLSISNESYMLKDDLNLRANIHFDSLDAKKLYSFYPIKDIKINGLIFADLSVSNSINDPNFNGSLDVVSGNFENKAFGAYYKDIQLNTQIKNNQISITKFDVLTNKKGTLSIDGFIDFKSDLTIVPEDFRLNIKSTNFQALKSNRVELNFDSDVTIAGNFENPRFNGNLKISRSRYNADYFAKYLMQKTDDPNPPLLITAMLDTNILTTEDSFHKLGSQFSGTKFYKNLNGEAVIQIPGNTWIRGKDMNFEVEGQLRVLKSTESLDLFGSVKVKRGFYKIYGKNFTFNKGELTFTGEKELNPHIDFSVLYRFRDIEDQLRKLTLNITGRLQQPEFEFVLDDEKIEEKDAIAYVVFGKSINQLSENQLNKLANSDNLALNLAIDQLSNILKETIQLSARLDVFEISGGNSSVTLGKYITNKLYLSYEQSFSLDKKSKFMDSEKLMLEYQLLRNIILKATNQNSNSGFDLIYKKTWK